MIALIALIALITLVTLITLVNVRLLSNSPSVDQSGLVTTAHQSLRWYMCIQGYHTELFKGYPRAIQGLFRSY